MTGLDEIVDKLMSEGYDQQEAERMAENQLQRQRSAGRPLRCSCCNEDTVQGYDLTCIRCGEALT